MKKENKRPVSMADFGVPKTGLKDTKKAFTLVELIIVITILAILATIAFVSFQGYTKNARDGNRLSTINSIEKGLELFVIKSGKYPEPESKINILASGSIIGYQGIFGDSASNSIKINKTPLDPSLNEEYIYSTNTNQNKYQILAYMEGDEYISFLPQTYANNYSNKNIKVFGDSLGILLNQDNSPILIDIDVVNYTGSILKAVLGNKSDDIISGTGKILAFIKDGGGKNCNDLLIKDSLKKNKNGVYYINPTGTESFQVYCDMTTDGGGWTLVTTVLEGTDIASIKTNNAIGNIYDINSNLAKVSNEDLNSLMFENKLMFEDISNNENWLIEYKTGQYLSFNEFKSYEIKLQKIGTSTISPWYNSHAHFILFVGITKDLPVPEGCTATYDRINYGSYIEEKGDFGSICTGDGNTWNPYIYWTKSVTDNKWYSSNFKLWIK